MTAKFRSLYWNIELAELNMKPATNYPKNYKPPVRTTANGGRSVRPSDIVRSTSGRAIIQSHAKPQNGIKAQAVVTDTVTREK